MWGNLRICPRFLHPFFVHGGDGNDGLNGGAWYTGLYYSDPAYFISWLGEIKPGLGAFLYGEAGNDVLNGSLRDDTMEGGTGHDQAFGALGNDTIRGDLDNDALNGDEGYDDLDGGVGNDWLLGGADADLLRGGGGDDVLYGDGTLPGLTPGIEGSDFLDGGDGDDRLFGYGGNDTYVINAGAGQDTLLSATDEDKPVEHSGTYRWLTRLQQPHDTFMKRAA